MKTALFICLLVVSNFIMGQSTFTFSGYTAGQTWTANSYAFTNTQNGTTMTAKVTSTGTPGWFNLTGANSPNYATYAPGSCGSFTGLFLATNRPNTTSVVSLEASFSPAVCGPLTFTIADLNGANASFRDDVTITAFDQNNVAIPLTTAMVTNNGSGSCAGNPAGYTPVALSGSGVKVIGCSYDDCYLDYFTIYSSTKMISRIVIDYASGNKDYNNTSITDPALQYIIISNIRAYTPVLTITPNCGTNPLLLTTSVTSPFPPSTSPWGVPASYPGLAAGAQPGAPTYSWTGTAGTITSPSSQNTTISGLTAAGGTFTVTGQNNRGCVATKSITINSSVCATLPIEMTRFFGTCTDNISELNWTTASEHNNDYFLLDQSSNGVDFETVATVDGAGTSTEEMDYSVRVSSEKGSYFRLRQVDFDGKSEQTDVIYVACEEPEVDVFPNPFENQVVVKIDKKNVRRQVIKIRDLNGKEVFMLTLDEVHQNEYVLDLRILYPGMYLLQISDEENSDFLINSKITKL